MSKTYGPILKCNVCKSLIRSNHRHDMVWCKCGAVAIDGGSCYTKITGRSQDYELIPYGEENGIDDLEVS